MDHLAAQNLTHEGKSSLAFRTISEVSVEIDVPQHVLRFWESRFSQVRPMKRGGGRRYYRPEDVELLRQIKTYLYKHGYTIKGVQRLLKEHRAGGLAALAQAPQDSPYVDEAPAEDFEQTFEATLTEVTEPERQAPAPETQMEGSLATITTLRDEIAVPPEPMRVDTDAAQAQAMAAASDHPLSHIASKETGYMSAPPESVPVASVQPAGLSSATKAELGEILAELYTLRDMLRSEAA